MYHRAVPRPAVREDFPVTNSDLQLDVDPAVPARGFTRRLREIGTVRAVVAAAEWATPVMRRILLRGPDLAEPRWTPGQHVRVHVPDGGRIVRRTYSVWQFDDRGLELRVFNHRGDGPGARWARMATPGLAVTLSRPHGHFVLGDPAAPYHVFVGDETGSVPLGAMLRALPPSATAYGAIETDAPADRLPLPGDVTWVSRAGAPAARSPLLVDAVRALPLPTVPGVAYVAGEARVCQAVRSHLVGERGWPRRAVVTKPFWTPGRTGLD